MNILTDKFKFVFGLISACLIVLNSPCFAFTAVNDGDYDSLIVKPKIITLKSKRASRLMYKYAGPGYQKIKDNIYLIPLSENDTTETRKQRIAELKQSGAFDLVEPDYKLSLDQEEGERIYTKIIRHTWNENNPIGTGNITTFEPPKEVTPNDKDFTAQYYLKEVNAPRAWGITVGSALLVGVLDTGVDVNHPDLNGKVSSGTDVNDIDLNDSIGHGTEVSGIIAANTNNNQGIAGVSWNTKVLSLKITDDFGQARVSNVVSALDQAYKKGVKIVHISLSTNQFSQTLKDAVKQAHDRGILIISTTGNSGIEELRYPAAFDGVIGVGAVDETKQKEFYSTTGDHVSLVAPGAAIYTTSLNSTYNKVTGTSFAAPQVSGAAALIWSIAPNLTNDEVRNILISSADDLGDLGKDKQYGYGLLNIEKAASLAKASTTSPIQILETDSTSIQTPGIIIPVQAPIPSLPIPETPSTPVQVPTPSLPALNL